MTSLIGQYTTLHNQIKERAVYINNLLSEVELPAYMLDFGSVEWCGVNIDALHMEVDINIIRLTYYPPYEDYSDTWTVNLDWIDMSDKEIIDNYFALRINQWEAEKQRTLDRLKREAEVYNFMITINTKEVADE